MRNAERVESQRDVCDDAVDFGVGTDPFEVDSPCRKDVAETVELLGGSQNPNDERVGFDRGVAIERVPESLAFTLDECRVFAERPLDAPHKVEDVVHTLRLRLCVPNQRGPQAPVVCARPFREVEQTGELGRLDLGGHDVQRTCRELMPGGPVLLPLFAMRYATWSSTGLNSIWDTAPDGLRHCVSSSSRLRIVASTVMTLPRNEPPEIGTVTIVNT